MLTRTLKGKSRKHATQPRHGRRNRLHATQIEFLVKTVG